MESRTFFISATIEATFTSELWRSEPSMDNFVSHASRLSTWTQLWTKLKTHVEWTEEIGRLKQAIDANDLDGVKSLMSGNPSLHRAPLGYGKNGPLTWVAECRVPWEPPGPSRLAMAQWMIDHGSDVHQGGDGPLMRAALVGHRIPMMELLVANGAHVNARWGGDFPIIFAPCETVDAHSLRWLLDHGADPMCGGRGDGTTALDYVIGTYTRSAQLGECIDLLMGAGCTTRRGTPPVLEVVRGRVDRLLHLLESEPSPGETPIPRVGFRLHRRSRSDSAGWDAAACSGGVRQRGGGPVTARFRRQRERARGNRCGRRGRADSHLSRGFAIPGLGPAGCPAAGRSRGRHESPRQPSRPLRASRRSGGLHATWIRAKVSGDGQPDARIPAGHSRAGMRRRTRTQKAASPSIERAWYTAPVNAFWLGRDSVSISSFDSRRARSRTRSAAPFGLARRLTTEALNPFTCGRTSTASRAKPPTFR